MFKPKKSLVVAAVALSLVGNAVAGDPLPGQIRIERESVRFSDLDLKTATGVATLHLRLREAARRICTRDGLTASGMRTRITCRNDSIDRAMVDAPAELQAYHSQWKSDGANGYAKPTSSGAQRLATTL